MTQHQTFLRRNNKSGYSCIHWAQRERHWVVNIQDGPRQRYVGHAKRLKDAVAMRDAARSADKDRAADGAAASREIPAKKT